MDRETEREAIDTEGKREREREAVKQRHKERERKRERLREVRSFDLICLAWHLSVNKE